MNREQLIQSAQTIARVSQTSAKEYEQFMESMVTTMNVRMLERPDIIELVGENNLQMMKDNHSNHVRFIHSILLYFDTEVLVDTILWVFRAYRSHHFATNYWAAQLNNWLVVIKEQLSAEAFSEISPLYIWMQINIPSFVICSDEKLIESKSQHLLN